MENQKHDKTKEFFKNEVLIIERNKFIFNIIGVVLGYVGITFWLNSIRATWSLWVVWILVIIQFVLYFLIFIRSYQRSKVCGLNKYFGIFLFTTLAFLGRVENWELIIIPSVVLIMIIFSIINKNISNEGKALLPKH